MTRWCGCSSEGRGDAQGFARWGPYVPPRAAASQRGCTPSRRAKDNPPAAPVPHCQPSLACLQHPRISHQQDPFPLIPSSPPQPPPLGAPSLAMYPFPTLKYTYISPKLASYRLECTRSGFYLVSNHKPGYGGGNTWFSWLANGKTSQ